jgi:hypothetical protein
MGELVSTDFFVVQLLCPNGMNLHNCSEFRFSLSQVWVLSPGVFRYSFICQYSVDLPNIQGIRGWEVIEKALPVYQSQ